MRLQKYIALCGVASRRKAEALIAEGKIQVNGITVYEMGVKIDPEKDRVSFNGKDIQPESEKQYILLNKPTGYVTTMKDQFDRPTVTDLVADIAERVYPVGRLDYNTSGLLIMTNDGDFANQIMHPSRHVDKTYIAKVKGVLEFSSLMRLREGIDIGNYTTAPAQVDVMKKHMDYTIVEITIHEGKNRQIRRMFDAVDHPVLSLKRISIGKIALGDLEVGKWRHLKASELASLRKESGKGKTS